MTKRNRLKQGADRAELAQAMGGDYATVANCWSEYASLAEEAIFAYAFKLGARLMLETLQ